MMSRRDPTLESVRHWLGISRVVNTESARIQSTASDAAAVGRNVIITAERPIQHMLQCADALFGDTAVRYADRLVS